MGAWRACNLREEHGSFAFDIELRGARLLSTKLAIPGRHNVGNALAAVALAYHAGAEPERVAESLATFRGVDRRLMWRGAGRGVTIVDDYGHHPTEIRVSIEAARRRYAPRRLWVVFQPHQVSRMQHFMAQFAASFGEADEVIVPDVYRARDERDDGSRPGSGELAARICRAGGRARYVPALSAAAELLLGEIAEGDLVLTMGAGDVWKVADELVERLCGSNRARCTSGPADMVPAGRTRSISLPAA
jgi:UDP-N-acetylmuramate--alanine ligase